MVRNTECFTAGFDEVRLSFETRSMCMCVRVCLSVLFSVWVCGLVRVRKCVCVCVFSGDKKSVSNTIIRRISFTLMVNK